MEYYYNQFMKDKITYANHAHYPELNSNIIFFKILLKKYTNDKYR